MAETAYISRLAEVNALLARAANLSRLDGASASLQWHLARVQTILQNHFIGLRVNEWPETKDDLQRADDAISAARGSVAHAEQLVANNGPSVKVDFL